MFQPIKSLWLTLVAIIIFAGPLACKIRHKSATPLHVISSIKQKKIKLLPAILTFQKKLQDPTFTATACHKELDYLAQSLFHLKVDDIELSARPADTRPAIEAIWATIFLLREKLQAYSRQKLAPSECIAAIRHAIRAARFMGDFLSERLFDPDARRLANYPQVAQATAPALIVNPKFAGFTFNQLKSGDILLTRRPAFTSSVIARLGDIDSQFSHLNLVYVDKITNQSFIIRAEIDSGLQLVSLAEHLNEKTSRSAVFRFHDASTASQAAKKIFHLLKKGAAQGKRIPFDFEFNSGSGESLFSGEMIAMAFSHADPNLTIPLFPSQFKPSNRLFLNKMGITSAQSFQPGDLEVDPRFDLVAEWRDLQAATVIRTQDAVLTMMLEWMEKEGYQTSKRVKSFLLSFSAANARRWPLFNNTVSVQFPTTMPPNILESMVLLNDTAIVLYDFINKVDQQARQRRGSYGLTAKEMYLALEAYRKQDFKRLLAYEQWKLNYAYASQQGIETQLDIPPRPSPPLFHLLFRPGKIPSKIPSP